MVVDGPAKGQQRRVRLVERIMRAKYVVNSFSFFSSFLQLLGGLMPGQEGTLFGFGLFHRGADVRKSVAWTTSG